MFCGREVHTGHGEADHEGVVVGTGHEADEEQRVGHGDPQGAGAVDAVQPGELGHVDHAQRHAHAGHEPEEHDGEVRLRAGDLDHRGGDPQEVRPVGGAGLGPLRVRAQHEPVVQGGDALRVRVLAGQHEPPLADVGVDVPGVDGHGEQQRKRPRHDGRGDGALGARGPAPQPLPEPQPRADEQHGAQGQQGGARVDPPHVHAQLDDQGVADHGGAVGDPPGPQGTQEHHDRTDHALNHGHAGVQLDGGGRSGVRSRGRGGRS